MYQIRYGTLYLSSVVGRFLCQICGHTTHTNERFLTYIIIQVSGAPEARSQRAPITPKEQLNHSRMLYMVVSRQSSPCSPMINNRHIFTDLKLASMLS